LGATADPRQRGFSSQSHVGRMRFAKLAQGLEAQPLVPAIVVVRKENVFNSTVALNGAVRATTWCPPTKESCTLLAGGSSASMAPGHTLRSTSARRDQGPSCHHLSRATSAEVPRRPRFSDTSRGPVGAFRHCGRPPRNRGCTFDQQLGGTDFSKARQ
jgi:hypothetical protein